MRSRLTRVFLLSLAVLVAAARGEAAETLSVPFTIVPGSLMIYDLETDEYEPASLPHVWAAQQFSAIQCAAAQGTASIDVVDGGLEIELDGQVVTSSADPYYNCNLFAQAKFTIEFVVPELGGTATMLNLHSTDIGGTFSVLERATSSIINITNSPLPVTSSFPDRRYFLDDFSSSITWTPSGSFGGFDLRLMPFIPGDTVQMEARAGISFQGGNTPSPGTQGIARARHELVTTVPEPTAGLTLPIGVAWLAWVAKWKLGV